MKNLMKFMLSPKGRISRMSFIISLIILVSICMFSLFIADNIMLTWLLPLLFVPVTIKRLHDVDIRGFASLVIYQIYALLAFHLNGITEISVANNIISITTLMYYIMWPTIITVFYLSIKNGDNGDNRFGTDPSWVNNPRVTLAEFLGWSGIALRKDEKCK